MTNGGHMGTTVSRASSVSAHLQMMQIELLHVRVVYGGIFHFHWIDQGPERVVYGSHMQGSGRAGWWDGGLEGQLRDQGLRKLGFDLIGSLLEEFLYEPINQNVFYLVPVHIKIYF